MMKMPILLSGHSMTPAGVLRPQSMSLNLRTDGLSSASMVLDEDNPDVAIGNWVQIWAPNGEMCVMYVKNRKKDYITGLITLSLEHTFGLLQAMVVFGEVTAATMSGTQSATTCTVTQAITYLLNQQTESLWTLYSCDFSDAQGWKFTNSDIYNDLNSLTDAIMDCQWEFDQSVFPWRLSLKAWPTSTTMEMRRNRNLDSLKVTQDRSDMYTRVYPTGKNNLHIDSVNSNVSYLDRNTATYGVIAQVITDSTIASADLLKAWAQKQLKKNAEPKYTVSITGYDLSAATGEPMDHFIIGRMCRIPLPEYSTTITERLTELSWKDCINQADVVTCTLANELKTITGVLNEKSRGGGGGSKKANTEHDCELKEGEEKIEEFDNSDIWINRDSVWAVCGAYEVTTWVDDQGVTHKKLKMKEGGVLTLERNHTEYGIYDAGNLTGGVIVDKINNQDGTTTITRVRGDRIIIGNDSSIDPTYRGKTLDGTLTEITTDFTSVNTLLANKIEASDINATTVQAAISNMTILRCNSMGCSGGAAISGLLNAAGNITTPYIELDGVSVGAAVYDVRIDGPTNNTYKLQKQTITGSGWVDCGSFSRAITSASWGWSGSAAKVTLSPQGQSFTSTLLVDNYSLSGSPTYNSTTGRISQHADILDSSGDTITYFTISIDATAAYNAGWNACRQYAIDHNGSTVLTGYSTYNSGRSTSLYTEPSSSASIASGAARVWRYGGSTATRYTLPAAK